MEKYINTVNVSLTMMLVKFTACLAFLGRGGEVLFVSALLWGGIGLWALVEEGWEKEWFRRVDSTYFEE